MVVYDTPMERNAATNFLLHMRVVDDRAMEQNGRPPGRRQTGQRQMPKMSTTNCVTVDAYTQP